MKRKFIAVMILCCDIFFVSQVAIAQPWQDVNQRILKQSDDFARTLSNIEREIAQQKLIERATISLTFNWIKPTIVRQTETYPSRGGIHKSKEISTTKTKITQCKGVLLENGTVATPEVCTRKKGWQLEKITLTFFDKTSIEKKDNEWKILEDICYIDVADSKKDVRGLPFSPIPNEENLWEHFGEDNIGPALESFLSSKGVKKAHYFGNKRYKQSIKSHLSHMELGDTFIYKGRVVALVKKKINYYYVTPEKVKNIFALFR